MEVGASLVFCGGTTGKSNHADEILMNPGIRSKLRMEGAYKLLILAGSDDMSVKNG